MKNADDMMKEIIKVVDTNGDGKIQYDGAPIPSVLQPFGLNHLKGLTLMPHRIPCLRRGG